MGSEREYVLKWHSFSSTIQGVFRRLLEDSAFADVTLSVENRQLQCHRLVLSACSTYFENLLTAHNHPHPIIILHDIPASVAQALIKFMYSGEIRLPQNQLQCFLKVAETLRIKGLTETDGKPKAPSPSCPEPDGPLLREALTPAEPAPPLPPLIPASVAPPVPRPAPPAAATVSWPPPPPLPAAKRRSPEPSHDRDEPGTPPREATHGAAKRRKSRAPVHAVHVAPEPEPEPEHERLQVKVEPMEEPVVEESEPRQNGETDQPASEMAVLSPKAEPTSAAEDEPEPPEGEEEEEEEEDRLRTERRLEEDIELVSGETTRDGPPPAPAPAAEEHRVVSPPTASQTVQSASEAAACTLMDSCGAESDGAPWKDPRWSNMLPEEKVMEAMGNMLDVPTLAAKLMKNLFTEEERINSNTTGDHGKQIFDREKMDLIKSIVFHVSKVDREDQFARDDLWVRCKMKIDKWNRDLRYARKKKDKDTSLPTMVKLDYATGGPRAEEDWDRPEARDGATVGLWLGGLGSPPAVAPQSADV